VDLLQQFAMYLLGFCHVLFFWGGGGLKPEGRAFVVTSWRPGILVIKHRK
jgi:hypothetical protein